MEASVNYDIFYAYTHTYIHTCALTSSVHWNGLLTVITPRARSVLAPRLKPHRPTGKETGPRR